MQKAIFLISCFAFTGTVILFSVAVIFAFTGTVIFAFTGTVIFILTKNQKKPNAVFIIIFLYIKALLYDTFRGKKMVPVAEKLLRDDTFRGKI